MEINNLTTTIEIVDYDSSVCEIIDSYGGTETITISINNLNNDDVLIYNDYVSTFCDNISVRIINSQNVFTVSRMTSSVVIDNVVEIDYVNLTINDKTKINNFYNLILRFK